MRLEQARIRSCEPIFGKRANRFEQRRPHGIVQILRRQLFLAVTAQAGTNLRRKPRPLPGHLLTLSPFHPFLSPSHSFTLSPFVAHPPPSVSSLAACALPPEHGLVRTKSSRRSGQEAWVRCIGRGTRGSAARSRSSCCQSILPIIRSPWRDSSGNKGRRRG